MTVASFYNLANVTLKFWAFGILYTIVRFRHIGIDIGTGGRALAVPALRAGRVVKVTYTPQMAWVVEVQVGSLIYAYCHLAHRNLPKVGDIVAPGDTVGILASSRVKGSIDYGGSAWNGIHLHLVITDKIGGAYTKGLGAKFHDPAPLIKVALGIAEYVVCSPIPLRAAPAVTGRVLGTLKRSAVIDIVGFTGVGNAWAVVQRRDGSIAYASRRHILARRRVVTKPIPLRAKPTVKGKQLATVPLAAQVVVKATDGSTAAKSRWVQVTVAGKTGWVARKFTK